MPRPKQGESKDDYVSRFMGSAEARKDYPDEKQRAAVAYSMWGERKNETKEWPKSFKCKFIEPGLVFYEDLGKDGMVLVKEPCLEKMSRTFIGRPVIDWEHADVDGSTV